jgi:protein-S-isoprenylcysteine O-methyltransferase Ste14
MDARTRQRLRRLRRLFLLYTMVAALLYFAQPTVASVAIGFGLVAGGEAIRWWAAGYLLKTVELVTNGPYRFTRNPLYLGRLLIFSGLCVMVNLPGGGSWIVLGVGWVLFFGIYLRRKERVEPARLRETHGEAYDRYFRAVPALFPTLRPYPAVEGQRWTAARMRRNREYWMIVGLAAIAAYLLIRALEAGAANV